ncbi:MAG: Na(+)-translocating NADH-quinone reductase subunit A [Pseudomonadota bacterium]
MQHFSLKKGLNLPVEGAPQRGITDGPAVQKVALLGADYVGLKPRLKVEEGDLVAAGSPVFSHKDTEDVLVTSPVSGRVKAINRGARRVLVSVEIEIAPGQDPMDFSSVGDAESVEGIATRLAASGLWTSFRTRPYSKVPASNERPAAIFVTAMDTEPLSADAAEIIDDDRESFVKGLEIVAKISEGSTYLCYSEGADVPGAEVEGVEPVTFSGPHPAGLAGTHMHFLQPPTAERFVWTIGYQDVTAIGRLFSTGRLDGSRIIALTGPKMKKPRLVRTIAGASMVDLTRGGFEEDAPVRLISGSILSGRAGSNESAYVGRYARQLTVIEEDKTQHSFGWIRPMREKYAMQPVLGSAFFKKTYALTSNLNGGRRAMVPYGTFEELMPQDFLPTQLLRAMLVMDTDQAQALGVLELDEEDMGLVGFACPAKYEYGEALRDCLTKIEKEG